MICVQIISASISLIVVDDFYELNSFFLFIFFALLFPLRGSFITV